MLRTCLICTTLITVLVWLGILAGPTGRGVAKDLMLWSYNGPSATDIMSAYSVVDQTHPGILRSIKDRADQMDQRMSGEQAIRAAYDQLPAEQRIFGEFHWYQLITNGLLHGGIMHLAGNMLFLLVLGSRVNALIGQWKTALLYPVLLVLSSLAQLISMSGGGGGAQSAIGASGAIMGLAGMYFVLFPVHRIFLVIWFRFTLWIFIPIWWTRVFYKIFKIRGFWVVLFCIGMDVLGTAMGSHDDIAHRAHLGGFIAGMTLALSLLFARQINANGGDLVSVLLGRRAWALIGKPADR